MLKTSNFVKASIIVRLRIPVQEFSSQRNPSAFGYCTITLCLYINEELNTINFLSLQLSLKKLLTSALVLIETVEMK